MKGERTFGRGRSFVESDGFTSRPAFYRRVRALKALGTGTHRLAEFTVNWVGSVIAWSTGASSRALRAVTARRDLTTRREIQRQLLRTLLIIAVPGWAKSANHMPALVGGWPLVEWSRKALRAE